jgi:transposase
VGPAASQASAETDGVDEIYRGKHDKLLTVVSNLETGEPLWFGKERKKETLDEYFRTQLRSGQRKRIEAACVCGHVGAVPAQH